MVRARTRLRRVLSETPILLAGFRVVRLDKRIKHAAELHFWRRAWDKTIRERGYWSEEARPVQGELRSYLDSRWAESRAAVARILRETGISSPSFFENKVVVDVGSGCVGMLEASNARVGYAIDPLADRYRAAGLLLDVPHVTYISKPAERMPFEDGSIDVIVSRNSLDHCDDPTQVVREILRVLRPGGSFLLVVDIGQPRNVMEPHTMTVGRVKDLLLGFEVLYDDIRFDEEHAGRWHAVKNA